MPRFHGSITELVTGVFKSNTHDITMTPAGGAAAPATITLPDTASDTLSLLNAAQTLTNKTISGSANTLSNIARTSLSSGSASHVLINNGSGVLSSEAQLAITRGGTGQTTANAAFNALSPMTTNGDIIYRSGGVAARLAQGGSGTVLTSDGAGGFSWSAPFVNPMTNPGEMVYGGAAGAATALGAGSSNQMLMSNGAGAPTWALVNTNNIAAGAVTDGKITGTITGSKIEAAGTGTPGIVSTGVQSFGGKKTLVAAHIGSTPAEAPDTFGVASSSTAGAFMAIFEQNGTSNSNAVRIYTGDSSASSIPFQVANSTGNIFQLLGDGEGYFSGDVGIGTPNPNGKIHLRNASAGGIVGRIEASSLSNGATSEWRAEGINSPHTGVGRVAVYKNASYSQPSGFVGLTQGLASTTEQFMWFNDSAVLLTSTTAGNIGSGSGTVVGTQTSDERLKTYISTLTYGLDEILALTPIEYVMGGKKEIGFGAQTTLPIIPEAVYDTGELIYDGGDTKLAMDYARIVPVLVNAVKKLHDKIEELENK